MSEGAGQFFEATALAIGRNVSVIFRATEAEATDLTGRYR
jgi:hypothetical protein